MNEGPGTPAKTRPERPGPGKGDLKALEPPLHGYCRLRVGGYRIVFAYGKRGTIECIFAERRNVVYELLLEHLLDRLRSSPSEAGG